MRRRYINWIRAPYCACLAAFQLFACAESWAQTSLLDEVHTVATVNTGVPIEHDFQVSAAGNYHVLLTDLGALFTPAAPLASVKLAITSGDMIVGTPLVGAGTLQFSAPAAGTYRLHVIGMPGSNP